MFISAQEENVRAVVFYSESADHCVLNNYTSDFEWIFSLHRWVGRATVIGDIEDSDHGDFTALIARSSDNGNGDDDNGGPSWNKWKDNDNPLGPSPSTAVAMIILYSITGLITGLFLLIIVTGAVRAHRHPERYGPRNIIGRPRQTRAKGLGRAILETLPIVKFGQREEPKPADVELGEATESTTDARDKTSTTESTPPAPATQDQLPPTTQQDEPEERRASVEGGIAAALEGRRRNSGAGADGYVGCSICTEDFEEGQDQRVLPCDHRFHPACIDPWLLNVSGTCPLCRIDLNPRTNSTAEVDENGNPIIREGDGEEPPPLGADGTPEQAQRMSIRRSIIIGLMGNRAPSRLTREERVAALRQLREQQLARQRREQEAAVTVTPEETRTMRQRLRDRLNIRRVSYAGRQHPNQGLSAPAPAAAGTEAEQSRTNDETR